MSMMMNELQLVETQINQNCDISGKTTIHIHGTYNYMNVETSFTGGKVYKCDFSSIEKCFQ